MKYLTFVLLIVFSFQSNASVELIVEHELTEVEYKRLGFLKLATPSGDEIDSPSQIFLTYPKIFKAEFEVNSVFLEVKNDEGVILEAWLNIEGAEPNSLNLSVINLVNPSVISISVSIKYMKYDNDFSIGSGHLIKLGNLDLLPKTTYLNYQKWKPTP